MKTVVVSVRLAPRLVSRLDALCQVSVQKRANIVRFLIARARLDDLPQSWRDLSANGHVLYTESPLPDETPGLSPRARV